jgi:L-ascorbate metabolism protein UlaG (beta-lactamase superfamily)
MIIRAIAVVLLAVPFASRAQAPQGQQTQAKPAGKVEVLWLGQSAIRVATPGGKIIVIDPFLTKNPKTPQQYKDLDALGKVDLLLVTHAHGDHLGDAVALSKKNNAPLYGPAGMCQSLITLGELPATLAIRMGKSGTITPLGPDIHITQVHAEHSSELLWHNPATDKDETHVGGEPVGFIIELENGFRLWHMGDTGLFGDMRMIAEHYHPDLLLIPIGGHFVMDPKDAAYATRDLIKPKYALPFHYGTIPQLKGTPAEYQQALGKTNVKVFAIQPGEKITF